MEENIEIWKDILGYEKLYQVSTFGRIKSLEKYLNYHFHCGYRKRKERILKENKQSRASITLRKDLKSKTHLIHRLVAIAFIPNPNNYENIHHIDYNPLNNNINNLMWVTQKQNMEFSSKAGRLKNPRINKNRPIRIRKEDILPYFHKDINIVLENEEFKFMSEFDNKYKISNYGRIISLKAKNGIPRIMKPMFTLDDRYSGNHLYVRIYHNSKSNHVLIHRFVAKYFIENPNNLPQTNHKDGNKSNNYVSNLEWSTAQNNTLHAIKMGLKWDVGQYSIHAKLTNEDVFKIRELYNTGEYSFGKIAGIYKVQPKTISNIIRKITWKNI